MVVFPSFGGQLRCLQRNGDYRFQGAKSGFHRLRDVRLDFLHRPAFREVEHAAVAAQPAHVQDGVGHRGW